MNNDKLKNSEHNQNYFQNMQYFVQAREIENSLTVSSENQKRYDEFKERLKAFGKIKSLREAISLSDKILPVKNEVTKFNIGAAKCTVIKKANNLRICLKSDKEFICYDFV